MPSPAITSHAPMSPAEVSGVVGDDGGRDTTLQTSASRAYSSSDEEEAARAGKRSKTEEQSFIDTEDPISGVDFDDDDDEDDFVKGDLDDDDDDSNPSSPPTLLGRYRSQQAQKEPLNLGASSSASLASFSIASIMGGAD
ncbi:hypothetical protein SK128_011201 [Halocaridina rubra]|uniref:Uncharacterized protein n=1 Tax=Halocaridina rubra TaxID=373956 RepID=A0AAN8ZQ51_HALRR